MSTESFSYSAHYAHIDAALKSLWQPFNILSAEMAAFVPRPLSDYEEQRRTEYERMRSMNQHLTDEQLRSFIDKQIELAASEKIQFSERFTDAFMTQYVVVAMLSHALCEVVINAILAIGLARRGSADLFSLLERADLKEKWRVGPKSLSSSYELPKGAALFETLSHLVRRRNSLVHYKIDLRVGDKTVLDGAKFERLTFQQNARWLRRFFSLPYDLAAHAAAQLKSENLLVLAGRSPIAVAEEHRAITGRP